MLKGSSFWDRAGCAFDPYIYDALLLNLAIKKHIYAVCSCLMDGAILFFFFKAIFETFPNISPSAKSLPEKDVVKQILRLSRLELNPSWWSSCGSPLGGFGLAMMKCALNPDLKYLGTSLWSRFRLYHGHLCDRCMKYSKKWCLDTNNLLSGIP